MLILSFAIRSVAFIVMTSIVSNLKSLLGMRRKPASQFADASSDPQLGFTIFFYPRRNSVGVQVIAARNLPQNFGNHLKVMGYFVKVKLYPGRDKFETNVMASSSPCFDEEFLFPVDVRNVEQLNGFFVNFTMYAEFEGSLPVGSKVTKRNGLKEKIGEMLKAKDNIELRRTGSRSSKRRSDRLSLNNRRSLGAITFKLEPQIFDGNGREGARFTADVWRPLGPISSGLNVESRESKKGCLEVTMKYSHSEDGKNDMIQISLTKFRCSMATMHEHEKLGGNLYLTITIFECDVAIAKWKGDTFTPTLSLLIEPHSAILISTIHNYNLDKTKMVLKLKCRNLLQQKITLGVITIDRNTPLFQCAVRNPTMSDKNMLDFK